MISSEQFIEIQNIMGESIMTTHDLTYGPAAAAALTILFLAVCAWNNRRTGYTRSSREAGWKEQNAAPSHYERTASSRTSGRDVTPTPLVSEQIREPLVYSGRVDDYSYQLIRFWEALHPCERVSTETPGQETRATQNSVDPRQGIHMLGGNSRENPEHSAHNASTETSKVRRTLLKNALRYFSIAFIFVLTATMLGQATVLLNGSALMGYFVVVAVIISAGRGIFAGVLATALSLLAMLSVFGDHVSISAATQNIVTLFVVIGIVTNLVFYKLQRRNGALTRAKADLEAHAKSLAEANSRLAEQKIALLQSHEQLRLLSKTPSE
jgi:hypothetical protein